MKEFIIVTIDGGAASGKSSTARALSERFGYLYVDTGAFYRTVTLALLQTGVNPGAGGDIEWALKALRVETVLDGNRGIMTLDGAIPGDELRSPRVNESVSLFSASPAVREFLLRFQRSQADVARSAGLPGLVMEGRDIGSVIFPDADFRFFLTADVEERRRRRAAQGEADEVGERDRIDSGRKTAPLICPPDAIVINSTGMSLDEVVDAMSRRIEAGIKLKRDRG